MMVLRFREGLHEYAGKPIVEHSYEEIRDKIWLSVKPRDLWDEYASSCVTFRIAEDYFAVCQIPLFESQDYVTSQVVEIFQLDEWKVSAEELFEQALRNQREGDPMCLYAVDDYRCYISEVMAQRPKNLLELEKWEDPSALMMLWYNEYKSFGANLMCDHDLLCKIRDRMNGGFYLFPISRHRILLQKTGRAPSFDDLCRMAREIMKESPDYYLGEDIEYFDPMKETLLNASILAGQNLIRSF